MHPMAILAIAYSRLAEATISDFTSQNYMHTQGLTPTSMS